MRLRAGHAAASTQHRTSQSARIGRTEPLLFAVSFVIFLLTASRDYLCLDVWTSNYASWSLATTGSPWIDGVSIPQLDHHSLRWVWIQEAANGHTVVTRAPGAVAVGLPAYWLSQPDTMTVLPGAITASALMALAVVLMYLALRTLMRHGQAVAAAAAFGFTTPVWSVAANGIWPQTITVLAIAMLAWAAATERWWVMGVAGGMLLWGRPHAAVIVAILGLVLAWRARSPGIAVRVAAPGFVSLLLLSSWTHWVYGSWNPTALYGAGAFAQVHQSLFDVVNQLGMWVAPDRGILVWTPVLMVLLPTLVRSWRLLPGWTTTLLLSGLAYTLLQSALISFVGGDPIYGYRYGLEFLACATPAFAAAACHVTGVAARLLTPVLALQFFVILVGAADTVGLTERTVWVDNAFVHVTLANSPFLPLLGFAVICWALIAERVWRRRSPRSAPGLPDLVPLRSGAQESPVR